MANRRSNEWRGRHVESDYRLLPHIRARLSRHERAEDERPDDEWFSLDGISVPDHAGYDQDPGRFKGGRGTANIRKFVPYLFTNYVHEDGDEFLPGDVGRKIRVVRYVDFDARREKRHRKIEDRLHHRLGRYLAEGRLAMRASGRPTTEQARARERLREAVLELQEDGRFPNGVKQAVADVLGTSVDAIDRLIGGRKKR